MFWDQIETSLEMVRQIHREWCENREKRKPEAGKQRKWALESIITRVEKPWKQWMKDMDAAFELKKTYVHDERLWILCNQEKVGDMKNQNELKYEMLATVDIDGFLANMLETGEQDIEMELDEMEKNVRTTWHFIRNIEEGYKDGHKARPMLRNIELRGGCGGDDNKTRIVHQSKKRKSSNLDSTTIARPNQMSDDSEPARLWPNNLLHIPGSSYKIPHVGKGKGKADSVISFLPEYLELNWWVILLRFHQAVTLIQSFLVLFVNYLEQSKGKFSIHRCRVLDFLTSLEVLISCWYDSVSIFPLRTITSEDIANIRDGMEA